MVRIDSFNVFLLFLTTFVLLIVAYHRKALLFSTCIYSSQHAYHPHQVSCWQRRTCPDILST